MDQKVGTYAEAGIEWKVLEKIPSYTHLYQDSPKIYKGSKSSVDRLFSTLVLLFPVVFIPLIVILSSFGCWIQTQINFH